MSTRAALLVQIARDLGWPTGSISSGGANVAVLGNHIGSFGDDAAMAGYTLLMPNAATAADQERTIEHWDDSEGSATWVRGRTDVTYTSETYILVPPGDYTRQDIYTAINDTLAKTRTTVPTVLPTIEGEFLYRLTDVPWLRSRYDVDAVYFRPSPNLIDNSQFDVWDDGPAAAPTGWVLAGAGATAARVTTEVPRGAYGVGVTRNGTDYTLTQTRSLLNSQLRGEVVSASALVMVPSAFNVARIGISDGITTTYSSYNQSANENLFVELTVSHTIAATARTLQFIFTSDGSPAQVQSIVSNFVAVEGSTIPDPLTDTGDSAYRLIDIHGLRLRQVGGQIAVELPHSRGRAGQLVVYSAQPFPALAADTDETLCPDDVVVPGAVYELTARMKKGQDRTRAEVLMARRGPEYVTRSKGLREVPVVTARSPVYVMGA